MDWVSLGSPLGLLINFNSFEKEERSLVFCRPRWDLFGNQFSVVSKASDPSAYHTTGLTDSKEHLNVAALAPTTEVI
jgi:hypothetical protein